MAQAEAELRAEIVIVGGGTMGCSAAYHLARAGRRDVIVVERGPSIASSTSAQATGLVTQVRQTRERIRIAMASVATFREFDREGEPSPAWRQVGSMHVAETPERLRAFGDLTRLCAECGLEVALIGKRDAMAMWPGLDLDRALGVLWSPSDGYLQPYDLATCYWQRARALGVRFLTGTRVEAIGVEGGRVTHVDTDRGRIRCGTVINAAGTMAYQVGRMVGLEMPIVPVRILTFVTQPIPGIVPTLPVIYFPDTSLNVRPDVNSLIVGGSAQETVTFDPRAVAAGEPAPGIQQDWEALETLVGGLSTYIPALGEAAIRHQSNGWPTFTPDGLFVIGESRRVRGFVMFAGCNAHGVAGSAGLGQLLVQAMEADEPGGYLASLSPDRFLDRPIHWAAARELAASRRRNYYAAAPTMGAARHALSGESASAS